MPVLHLSSIASRQMRPGRDPGSVVWWKISRAQASRFSDSGEMSKLLERVLLLGTASAKTDPR